MSDFARLRQAHSPQALQQALASQKKFQRDERYWRLTTDQQGNGWAIFRFIPAPPVDGDNADPYVLYYKYSFKGPGGQYYIERSLTTLGKPDPVAELNSKLWQQGGGNKESPQCKQASAQKRKATYVSNIYMIQDPAHPENNGKVFLYEYGKKIMDKIQDKNGTGAPPSEFADPTEVKYNPFNLWEGANFKLKATKQDKFPNYDKSEFLVQGPLFADDLKIEEIWRSGHSLKAEMAADKFKSYDDLKARLNSVLGLEGQEPAQARTTPDAGQIVAPATAPVQTQRAATAAEVQRAVTPTPGPAAALPPVANDDEDDFAAFQRLAQQGR